MLTLGRRSRPTSGPADRQDAARGAVEPRQLDPRIPRDLETIVLKAIAKEPADRYPTAGRVGRGPAAVPGRPADPGPAGIGAGAVVALVPAQPVAWRPRSAPWPRRWWPWP